MNWTLPILTFLMTAAADICWVRYVKHASQDRVLKAANWAVLLAIFGSAFTLAVSEKNLVAYFTGLAGAWFGTVAGMRMDRRA